MIKLDNKVISQFLDYNKETGILRWKHATPSMFNSGKHTRETICKIFNTKYAGKEAFTSINGNGYKAGVIAGIRTTAHRAIWCLVYGYTPKEIDHINHNRTDNRLSNLREVSHKTNSRNSSISAANTSGVCGVRFQASRGKWCADIRVNGKLIFLGRFKTKDEAVHARRNAEEQHGFHANHGS